MLPLIALRLGRNIAAFSDGLANILVRIGDATRQLQRNACDEGSCTNGISAASVSPLLIVQLRMLLPLHM